MDIADSLGKITTYVEYSKGYLCRCPFAPKTHQRGYDRSPSLAVWPEIGFFKCYACGQCGKIPELFTKLAAIIPNELHLGLADKWENSVWRVNYLFREKETSPKIILDEDILEHFPKLTDFSYLDSRGVSREVVDVFDLRYDPRSDRVVFPVRDKTSSLVGFVGRGVSTKSHWKYFFESNLVLGGEDKLAYERIIVVEGFFDLLKAWPWARSMGLDIVCCWTATLSDTHINTLAKLDKYVYLMLDQDAAGNKGANKFAKVYPGLSTRLQWNFENEKGEISDVGDFTEQQFRGFFECSNAV